MKQKKRNISAITGTLLFHALLILCFVFFGFRTPLPLPAEEGVEVNLGYSDQGTGEIEPLNPASQQAVMQNNSGNNDDYSTQNTDESISLNQKNNNKSNNDNQNETPINQNALYNGKKNNNGGSQGITGNQGNQGNPNGNPNSNNYNGNSPSGDKGIKYNLGDRKSKSLPKPVYNSKEEGIVVVTIWVDKKGKVTKAVAGARGTTTTSQTLWKLAQDAALRSTFSDKSDAPEEQKGTITYNFINLN